MVAQRAPPICPGCTGADGVFSSASRLRTAQGNVVIYFHPHSPLVPVGEVAALYLGDKIRDTGGRGCGIVHCIVAATKLQEGDIGGYRRARGVVFTAWCGGGV
eukprot:scaffold6293_cov133-Isochrysis_galbana.AAC.5